MSLTLSWDLLIILFTVLVVAYSFIVGKDASIKIIVATYISLVAVEALGNIVVTLTNASTASMVGLSIPPDALVIGKTVVFAFAVVFMAMKGGINIQNDARFGTAWDIAIAAGLGLSTATLLLTSLVTYITGKPLLDPTLPSADALGGVELTSPLVGAIVQYQHVWFALPAILLLVLGFLSNRSEE